VASTDALSIYFDSGRRKHLPYRREGEGMSGGTAKGTQRIAVHKNQQETTRSLLGY